MHPLNEINMPPTNTVLAATPNILLCEPMKDLLFTNRSITARVVAGWNCSTFQGNYVLDFSDATT
jgi:hypothetical protein